MKPDDNDPDISLSLVLKRLALQYHTEVKPVLVSRARAVLASKMASLASNMSPISAWSLHLSASDRPVGKLSQFQCDKGVRGQSGNGNSQGRSGWVKGRTNAACPFDVADARPSSGGGGQGCWPGSSVRRLRKVPRLTRSGPSGDYREKPSPLPRHPLPPIKLADFLAAGPLPLTSRPVFARQWHLNCVVGGSLQGPAHLELFSRLKFGANGVIGLSQAVSIGRCTLTGSRECGTLRLMLLDYPLSHVPSCSVTMINFHTFVPSRIVS
ncbi:hypothetical protein PR048_004824 [Dryococelus australis]|uniref:Uncharacterized protein n=1 Tax=Dryococelus australis TaxID=614101 RepID=A0ABQ9I6H8_9NEOP|nr:hypothetical protein PR048_004824 [Dryococelus australis]